jgi:hypothetical protein
VRQIAADELDELSPPPPVALRRPCSRSGCRGSARPGGRYCRPCATAATRAWRERHKAEIAAREKAREWTEPEKATRRARAYIAELIKRGKLKRGRCETCRDWRTLAAWDDPKRPRNVRWFCAEHYGDRRALAKEAAASKAEAKAEWAALRDEVAQLPPAVHAQLHEAGLKGPFGRGAEAGSVWYWWTLRRELQRVRAEQRLLLLL